MKNRTRQLITTALITSVLSILIGGFAVVSTYQSEIALIDKRLNQVESDIRVNPIDRHPELPHQPPHAAA